MIFTKHSLRETLCVCVHFASPQSTRKSMFLWKCAEAWLRAKCCLLGWQSNGSNSRYLRTNASIELSWWLYISETGGLFDSGTWPPGKKPQDPDILGPHYSHFLYIYMYMYPSPSFLVQARHPELPSRRPQWSFGTSMDSSQSTLRSAEPVWLTVSAHILFPGVTRGILIKYSLSLAHIRLLDLYHGFVLVWEHN